MRAERKKVKIYRRVILTSVLRKNLPLVFEDISDSFHRMKKLGFEVFVDFIPQMRDMDIDDIGRCVKMEVKDLFRDHGPGDDLAWVSHEKFKESIFFGGEFNLHPVSKNPVTVRLQDKVGYL